MPRKFFRRYLPDPQSIANHRWLGRFGTLLQHPALWCLSRRGVAGGVAIGLFAGLVPGPLQMLTAALLAIPLRRNLPVALACTLYTNPFTIVPLYLFALWLGTLITGATGADVTPAPDFSVAHMWQWFGAMLDWAGGMGKPLIVGLLTLGLGLAAIGWIVVELAWRAWVVHAWRQRSARRRRA
jgi:uncharacterized protein (DUF2062 family)